MKWGITGLDISDAGFNKLHSKEQTFEESSRKRYDLEKEGFLNYSNNLIEKVIRIYGNRDFTIQDSTTPTAKDCFVLTEYTKLTQANVLANRNERWPVTDPVFSNQNEYDKFVDSQIKASTIGAYIHDSLTESAKRQLKSDEDFIMVKDADRNQFYDGPTYFWKLAEIVDTNNDSMIETERNKLKSLNVKDHGYIVIKMMTEFNNIRTRVEDLGGTYSSDEQYLDFWNAMKTIPNPIASQNQQRGN